MQAKTVSGTRRTDPVEPTTEKSETTAARATPAPPAPDAPRGAHGKSAPSAQLDAKPLPEGSPLFAARAEAPAQARAFDAAQFDRRKFFDAVRNGPFNGRLTQGQVDGMNTILDEWEHRGMKDLRWLAYMLATTFHETARTMQPIEEFGKGRGKKYGRRDPVTGKAYYGRGFVQLTWKANYEKMGRLLNVDLVRHPELALRADIATAIMFEGMTRGKSAGGDFTGKSLEDYFNDKKTDWVNARRIINGTDRAATIAGYAKQFHADLRAAQT